MAKRGEAEDMFVGLDSALEDVARQISDAQHEEKGTDVQHSTNNASAEINDAGRQANDDLKEGEGASQESLSSNPDPNAEEQVSESGKQVNNEALGKSEGGRQQDYEASDKGAPGDQESDTGEAPNNAVTVQIGLQTRRARTKKLSAEIDETTFGQWNVFCALWEASGFHPRTKRELTELAIKEFMQNNSIQNVQRRLAEAE